MSEPSASIQIKSKVTNSDAAVNFPQNDENSLQNVCKFCVLVESKYTCPRCNLSYCSLKCYQSEKHGSCSEAFYKECVLDELKDTTSSNEDRMKVLEMLANNMEERENDVESNSEEGEDLSERLQGLDLDKDVREVWGRLNSKEKEEFARMLQDGRLARLIEIWTPWWIIRANQKLVREADNQSNINASIPDICSDIPDITNLLKNLRPSSNCRFDLLNTLIAYAFVTRLHNGGHTECAADSSQDLIDTCMVLKGSYSCSSVGEAVQSAIDTITKKSKNDGQSFHFNIALLQDAKLLISGPGTKNSITFMSAALSDMLSLLRDTYLILKRELREGGKTASDITSLKEMKAKVFKAEKKSCFLLSWLQQYGIEMHKLIPLLQFEIETRESEISEVEDLKVVVEGNMDKLKPTKNENDSSVTNIDQASLKLDTPKILELD